MPAWAPLLPGLLLQQRQQQQQVRLSGMMNSPLNARRGCFMWVGAAVVDGEIKNVSLADYKGK